MSKVKNILFIMADQLRADYLSCYGHPKLQTTNMDWLAGRGVRFSRAYVQAPVCGPSRMCFYTGRYVRSHGSTYNGVPLRVGEMTMGDHLRPLGLRVGVVGKTHMTADRHGMRRLGVDLESAEGKLASEAGFEPYERDDGLWPDEAAPYDVAYNRYLRAKGYNVDNPWHEFANSGRGEDGEVLSGWFMRNAPRCAAVDEQHSETAYMTDRAIDFIEEAGDQPWCLHLSYIKPHWPYIAPAPYHDMYGPDDVLPANRTNSERENPHPVIAAFMQHEESENFARDEVREAVIPAYMGLVKQLDDHLGRLFAFLEARGLFDNTMIVVTSDHGDYLGDHWLGEKELFHEESARIPLIVYDPDNAADASRGSTSDLLVEAIDLAPTFVEAAGGIVPTHVLEGRSLIGVLRGSQAGWRDAVFSECDYSFRKARQILASSPSRSRGYMIRTDRWKYIEYDGFRPQLFDLETDPHEQNDLGTDSAHELLRRELHERLFEWMRGLRMRVTLSDEEVEVRTDTHRERGYFFGVW